MNTTPLELRLHDLAAAFARRIAKLIGELTIEELAALCGDGAPVAKARRKPKAAPKGGPRTVVAVDGQPEPQGQSIQSMLIRHSPQGDGGPSISSTPPAPTPPPEDRAAAFRRAEQERLETAVLKFVALNPETDAEIVAVRVGLPKGKAQDVLDDLVLKGRLRMKSGQHGRCYVGVEERKP